MSALEIEVLEATASGATASGATANGVVEMPRRATAVPRIDGVVIGTLIGFKGDGGTALVTYPDQPGTAALAACAILDLHGAHIGKQVLLQFERGDPTRPVVMGLLRQSHASPLTGQPGQVEVDVDGERMIVSAREQLVLKCGKASITLTKAGKVLVQGTYVSNRSSGVMRIKGGSVQLN